MAAIAVAVILTGFWLGGCAPALHGSGHRPVKKNFEGNASYYGNEFAGRKTANGERFNPGALTAAHRTLPFGTRVRVTNPENGKSVVVRVNDRGPFKKSRIIDLSYQAAKEIGIIRDGIARVVVKVLE